MIYLIAAALVLVGLLIKALRKPTPMPEWMEKAEEEINRQQQRVRLQYREFEIPAAYQPKALSDRMKVKHIYLARRLG
jgi:hypothetical protein